jgi:2-methylcitrate dehydratase
MDGDVTLDSFGPDKLNDANLLALTAKVRVHRDAGLSARYPRGIPNRLTVKLKDGRQLVREVEFPRGHAQNPMTDAEVEKKFRQLVEPRYGKERSDRILQACWKLEELGLAGDLVRLFDEWSRVGQTG